MHKAHRGLIEPLQAELKTLDRNQVGRFRKELKTEMRKAIQRAAEKARSNDKENEE